MIDTDTTEREARQRLRGLDDPVAFLVTSDLLAGARSRGRQMRRRRRSLVAVPLAVLALGAGLAAWVGYRADQVHRVDVATGVLAPVEGGHPFNILVVGTDGPRGQADVRTDTIMVVRVDQAAHQIRILSIPRDLTFTATGRRIDTLLSQDGASALIQTVEEQLDIPIAHFVELDPAGLAALVDQVGGVGVAVNTAVRDANSGLSLTPGCHVLDGQAALALARARELQVADQSGRWTSLAGADLQREADQQALVATIGHKLLTLSPSPSSLSTLLDVFADHTTVDSELSLAELMSLATWGSGLSSSDLTAGTLPVTPYVQAGGADVLRPEAAEPSSSGLPAIPGTSGAVATFLAPASSQVSGGAPAGVDGSTTTTSPVGTTHVFTPCG